MAKTNGQILNSITEKYRIGIIASQKAKGLYAFGKSAAGLQIRNPSENISQVYDSEGTFQAQEYGVGPGTSGDLNELIKWVGLQKYGIKAGNEKRKIRIALSIKDNQQQFGTYIHRKGKPTGVVTEVIKNEKPIDEGMEEFAAKYGNNLADSMVNTLLGKSSSSDFNTAI